MAHTFKIVTADGEVRTRPGRTGRSGAQPNRETSGLDRVQLQRDETAENRHPAACIRQPDEPRASWCGTVGHDPR
jgi:hypothetical protein